MEGPIELAAHLTEFEPRLRRSWECDGRVTELLVCQALRISTVLGLMGTSSGPERLTQQLRSSHGQKLPCCILP